MKLRVTFFIAAFALFLAIFAPLRLGVNWFGIAGRGFAAREAAGSIWGGTLRDVQIGSAPLGDLRATLNFLPLFVGRARVSLVRPGEAAPFRGAVTVSPSAFGIDNVTGQLPAGRLFTPLPVASIDFDRVSIRFVDGRCSRAEGNVRANLAGDVAGMALQSGFVGTATCAEEAALIPLASQSGMERLELRLFADGRYRAELSVRPSDPAFVQRLTAAGFSDSGGLFVRRIEGSF